MDGPMSEARAWALGENMAEALERLRALDARALAAEAELAALREFALRVYRDTRTGDPGPGCPARNLMIQYAWVAQAADKLRADNAALRAALSRLAACAFGPPGELLAAADAARELLGE
jgi:hypothetical protein